MSTRLIAFKDILGSVRPKKIVEVGTWLGGSCFEFMSAAKEMGIRPSILCIDTWLGSWEHWNKDIPGWGLNELAIERGEPQIFAEFLKLVAESEFHSQINWLRCASQSSGRYLKQNFPNADLVYIDGDHSTASVGGGT